MADYSNYITAASQKYGVPSDLIKAVIQRESGGNPYAVGSIGERGLMQLTPKYYPGVDGFNPSENINAGTRSLSEYYKRFGNWRDALSYYNGGSNMTGRQARGYADSVLQKAGISDTGDTQQPAWYQNKYVGKAMRFLGGESTADSLDMVWSGNPLSATLRQLPVNRLGRIIEKGAVREGFNDAEVEAANKASEQVKDGLRKFGLWALAILLVGAGTWRLVNS